MTRYALRFGQFVAASIVSLVLLFVIGPAYALIAGIIALTAMTLMLRRSWPGAWFDRILIVGLGLLIGVYWPMLPIIAGAGDEKRPAGRTDCDGHVCRQSPCVCDRKGERV